MESLLKSLEESGESSGSTHHSVEHLFRHHSGQMVSTLTRIFGLGHLDQVEDAVQDSLLKALHHWPYHGVPNNPKAWLVQVAKNRLLDRLRRKNLWQRKQAELERVDGILSRPKTETPYEAAFHHELEDDQLKMIFACCNPQIPQDGQVALTLKTVGGFSTSEIARAFLARETTIAQRLVRAKKRLRIGQVSLEIPSPEKLPERQRAVLEALYLMFNEGYSALTGEDLVREDLCFEALRLVRLLAQHPSAGGPIPHALAALFFFQASRLSTRVDVDGDLLLLSDQDRSLWDRRLIQQGLQHLQRSAKGVSLSTYHLEAEIAAHHATAESFAKTDWRRILACYDSLLSLQPSPVVALNRVIILAQVEGPEVALRDLHESTMSQALAHYYPLHATRGDLLFRLNRTEEARACYEEALGLTSSEPVRRFLRRRMDGIPTRLPELKTVG